MKRIKITKLKFISLLMPVLFMACKNNSGEDELNVQSPVPVEIVPIGMGSGHAVIEATGTFSTDNEILLSFKNGGIIEKIYVKEGDAVRKGQILASVNMTEINARATQGRLALQKAERDYSRARQLFNDSVATREQMENAKTALDVTRQDWNSIQFNLQYAVLKSPADGYILRKFANEGQIAGPGMPVFQMNGTGKSAWVVKAGVSDRDWARIQRGDDALVTSDVFPGGITSTVIRKSEGLDPQSGTFTIYVRPNSTKGLPLAAGLFARVKIMGKSTASWSVPYSSLLDGDEGKGILFVTDDKKTAVRAVVTIGSILRDSVTILSGLEGHNYLIISGSPYLKEGSEIKIVNR